MSGPTQAAVKAWFAARGWTVFPFQREVWKAALAGRSGLLHANTGAGKTFAVWFAALQRGALAKGGSKGRDGTSCNFSYFQSIDYLPPGWRLKLASEK